jgi:orotate phosphoribosyltransferase
VVTTGASTLKAIERAVSSGLRVAAVVALCDRLEGGRDAVTPHAPLHPLFTRKDFLP